MKKGSLVTVITVLGGLIVAVIVSYVAVKEAKRDREIDSEIEALRQEAEKIRSNNQELQERISYFQTSDFQEKVAKEKLNLQKPDEQVVIIKPSPSYNNNSDAASKKQEDNQVDTRQNWKKWLDYFFR